MRCDGKIESRRPWHTIRFRTSAFSPWPWLTPYVVWGPGTGIHSLIWTADCVCFFALFFAFIFDDFFLRHSPERGRQKDSVFNFKFQHNFNVYTLHLSFRPFGDISLFFCVLLSCPGWSWNENKKRKRRNERTKYHLIICDAGCATQITLRD